MSEFEKEKGLLARIVEKLRGQGKSEKEIEHYINPPEGRREDDDDYWGRQERRNKNK